MFNLGHSASQHVLIMEDQFGIIEAHTFSKKDLYQAELELAQEFEKKILFKKEVNQD
jgi:hypothetical protein